MSIVPLYLFISFRIQYGSSSRIRIPQSIQQIRELSHVQLVDQMLTLTFMIRRTNHSSYQQLGDVTIRSHGLLLNCRTICWNLR